MSIRLVYPVLAVVAVVAVAACSRKQNRVVSLPTATISRGNIAVRVQATGTVEPIDPVDIKSKANGMVIQMPVEVGSVVKRGDLLAQVDPRDVRNQYDQAAADDVVSAASLATVVRNQARLDSLFAQRVIAASAHDSTKATLASAKADLTEKRASLDLARQKLEDATVRAPISGTIVSRPVTQGQIITSAMSANGGTTLMTVADLGRVRMRVTIDEVEMGNIRVGEPASVAVDAFRDRTFEGVIEKIEPQAVVTQGVTFFPVMVNIDNKDGLLLPGMNGEVTIRAADLSNVAQIPIDATRSTSELAPVARMFGVSVDSLISQLRKELVPTDGGTTGVPARYAVVALPDSSYEMRLIKTGPSDLRVAQVLDGVKEGDRVVMLGAIMTGRPTSLPNLQIAANMRRPASGAQSVQAGEPVTPAAGSGAKTKSQPAAPSKARQAQKP
ncbi:MAG TPA: efflux RND transporter periplasmic adaptor subunit [Gemmatimonadaceae bacterium]|jgi:HlyD family secretion protein|nr:efflux RND transporter periplasmic adaptor subunit [Gemmatimonadaceae bacterium]